MTKSIEFINTLDLPIEYYPVLSKSKIPDWYKSLSSHSEKLNVGNSSIQMGTMKKCMPVFDAITAGYLLLTHSDVKVERKNGVSWYHWSSDNPMVEFHPAEQASGHPTDRRVPVPKWASGWGIITPRGYSSLFVSPMHHESVFTTFEGIVDTDSYHRSVKLPFMLKDPEWEGTIPAGTPMAQVLPFKRDSFSMKVSPSKKHETLLKLQYDSLTATFFNGYKNKMWKRKSFN
jgi:hypothetical protein